MTCQLKTSKINTHIKHKCIFDIKVIKFPQRNLSIFFTVLRVFTYFNIAKKAYPKDPRIVPYPLATLKCSYALTSWTCADFFFT